MNPSDNIVNDKTGVVNSHTPDTLWAAMDEAAPGVYQSLEDAGLLVIADKDSDVEGRRSTDGLTVRAVVKNGKMTFFPANIPK